MILSIDYTKLRRVDENTFNWFIKNLRKPERLEYANCVAWYQDNYQVAVREGDAHYVRPKQ